MIAERHTTQFSIRPARAARQGQTIVVSLLVLLLLAFAGALFVTIVARNLINAGRQTRGLTAAYYAQQGIQFVDSQLTNSVDGADWRPPKPVVVNANDPDAQYLNATNTSGAVVPSGFYRYNTGGGRFLVRVTYNPTGNGNSNDPLSHLIKIESIGREGEVNAEDPTTWTLRDHSMRYMVAYKAIGITDYARFETNIDKRTEVMNVGVPSRYDSNQKKIVTAGVYDVVPSGASSILQQFSIITQYGAPDAYLEDNTSHILTPNPLAGTNTAAPGGFTLVPGGGTFRSNATVRWFGENYVYLNSDDWQKGNNLGESVQIAGNLLLDNYQPPASADPNQVYLGSEPSALIVNPTSTTNTTSYVVPSTDQVQPFNSIAGSVRDGQSANDASGYPRFVKRVDPPVIDNVDPSTGLTRYTNAALTSAPRKTGYLGSNAGGGGMTVTDSNAAMDGYGKVVYIDNGDDVQPESSKIVGGYTLVDDWLNRASAGTSGTGANSYWKGDFYEPPGVQIIFGRIYGLPNEPFGITIIKDKGSWKNPDGTTNSSTTGQSADSIMYIPFKDLGADSYSGHIDASNPNNDVVIVAAGNVRTFGIVSEDAADNSTTDATERLINQAARHVTIVSGGTAYIDGSLLKGNPASSIAVLAHDYVCVNPTQFTAGPTPASQIEQGLQGPVGSQEQLDMSGPAWLVQQLRFGLPNGNTPGAAYGANNLALYFSGSPQDSTSGTQAAIDFSLFDPTTGRTVGNASPPPGHGTAFTTQLVGGTVERGSIDLFGMQDTSLTTPINITAFTESQPLELFTSQYTGQVGSATITSSLNLERVAVLPADIRIEAMLYAQERSFFVIPGPWFNSQPADNINTYIGQTTKDRSAADIDDTTVQGSRFPFYGQPIDLKITIYGAVSEARPADISAQADWMRKWGWIPQYHGSRFPGGTSAADSSGSTTEHAGTSHLAKDLSGNTIQAPGQGLTMIYDPLWGYPVVNTGTAGAPVYAYARTDVNGYPLPYAPKLPVCPGLLYSAQPTQLPLP